MKDLWRMLPCWQRTTPTSGRSSPLWAAAVRSAATVWSCSWIVSEAVNIAVDTTRHPRTRGRHPDTGQATSCAVHCHPASRCQLSWRWSADHIGNAQQTRSTMCCFFRTAPMAFTWTSRRTAKRSWWPLWNTIASDWCSAATGPECRAVRRQAVPAVRCRCLRKNGIAAAKLFMV